MTTPYSAAARAYFEAGWSPIPLPFEEKFPPPDQWRGEKQMFTGVGGVYVTEEHLKVWLSKKGRAQAGKLSFAPGNIALRLPPGVIGVDVDAYGEKKGGETLAAAEMEWGPLPPTWVTTSKKDGVSGIRLYRIPPGLKWPGQLPQGGGVELIRWDHRFAIVGPSVHDKTKALYRWLKEEWEGDDIVMRESPDEFPDAPPEGEEACDIPWLPTEWVEGLTGGQEYVPGEVNEDLDGSALNRWLEERNGPYDPCSHMRKMLTRWSVSVQKAADDGGAHDEMRDAIWGALNDAKAGHSGIIKVLGHLRSVFLEAVKNRRPDEGAAKSEWARTVLRGGQKVTADDNEPEEEDPCDSISAPGKRGKQQGSGSASGSSEGRSGSRGSRGTSMEDPGRIGSADIEECTEVGNANRLVRVLNGRGRWVEAHQAWYLWDAGRGVWAEDDTRQMDRWAVKAINGIEEELAYLKGEEAEAMIKAYKAHRKASLKVGALEAMKTMAKGRKGIMLSADLLDANPQMFAVGNGHMELTRAGYEFRPPAPEALLTMSTRTRYRAGAWRGYDSGSTWAEFLLRFQPDEEVRDWLNRIVGYSLLGRNSARFLVAMQGKTSTGKSTFAEAIRRVLGDLAAPMTASMLRDNQDDRPRPDLLAALSRRVIIAEELGAAQHLHADQVKRLTGGTVVTARGMRSNVYINRVPAFTPWIVANDVPTIEGADNALLRRLLVVPWTQQIKQSEEDLYFMDRLMEEESAEEILSWCLYGYTRYCEAPQLAEIPVGALSAATEFKEGMNEFASWAVARTDVGDDLYELPMRLYEDYQDWCRENGVKERDVLTNTAFGRKLNGMEITKGKRTINGKQVWVREGIRLVRGSAVDAT